MTWKRTCIWKRDSMEFRNATSARLVMLMQTSHNDALKWKWKWNWNCKRLVTHLRPTKGSCANFLDPLSRRCARLNHCQPTSLSFKLHQKFNGWNFKRNKSEWESRHHLDLIPVEICHMQDLKNICWHQNGHLHLLPGMHTPRNNNMCWKRKGLTVLPLSLSLALH